MRFGFIGPAYTGRAKNADGERSINLFLEKIESDGKKTPMVLLGTPGLATYCNLNGNSIRGLWKEPKSGRVFAVCDRTFWEITAGGNTVNRGTLTSDPAGPPILETPVPMRSNGTQLVLTSNGIGYLFTLAANTFQPITVANFPNSAGFPAQASQLDFLDQYIIALDANSQTFNISALNDATNWNGLDFASKVGWPDNIAAVLMNLREVWLFGVERTEVWYDSGNPAFPIQPISGGVMEVGCAAPATVQRLDNSVFWLGGDEKGQGIAYRTNGYQPARISNHAVEYQWSEYAQISDAEAWGYQEGGHSFYVLYFPSGDPDPGCGQMRGATWVYDVASGSWHERAYWDAAGGTGYHAHLGRNHCFGFGLHLVGARNSGRIYQQSLDLLDDDGAAIRRLRSCPVFQEMRWVYYEDLILYLLSGQVQLLDGSGNPRNPLCSLRISDDGGFKWGIYWDSQMGRQGQYLFKTYWNGLGRSQDRAFEWTCSEKIPIAINEAFLNAKNGSGA